MQRFNGAYQRVLAAGRLTFGLMTPLARAPGEMADIDMERRAATLADRLGFEAVWTRDVPLAIPQGSDGEAALADDPFVWLAVLAAVTGQAAIGTAAAVLPLRHPLHLAKSAMSLDRVSGGRFILGLGSGDREAEFTAFGQVAAERGERFRQHWEVLRSALATTPGERQRMFDATGGYDLASPPVARIPMLAVGSARQTLQWIAANADGWASYHRDEVRQQGRIHLWKSALDERASGYAKPFVQSLHLDLQEDPAAPAVAFGLGMRTGRDALVEYLRRLQDMGTAHVIVHVARGQRSALDVVEEIGREVVHALRAS